MAWPSFRDSKVQLAVFAVTTLFVLLGVTAGAWLDRYELFIVLGLMLLLGLPHGATDRSISRAIRGEERPERPWRFYGRYLGVIGLYGLLWFVLPGLAFLLFIGISIYHFGQSNWCYVDYGRRWVAIAHFFIWGSAVLLTPILLHGVEAVAIVSEMTGAELSAPDPNMAAGSIATLAFVNGLFLLWLWRGERLSTARMGWEATGFVLLMGLYLSNSLLIGFTVYFVFWHSLASLLDQLRFFQRRFRHFHQGGLLKEILPIVLGALAFCLAVWFGPVAGPALDPRLIGGVFIFIALLTLPHMLLVDHMYQHWETNSSKRARVR
jgi:Brp/Blh family beta-carotene 15,15'-monooxygenase